MIRGKRPLVVLCSPLVVTLIATAVMVTLRRRELSQERAQPGLGIRLPEIRQVSAETAKKEPWRLRKPLSREAGAQLARAEEVAREARMDPMARDMALQELRALYGGLPSDSPESPRVLHLLGKAEGMWGAQDLEGSLGTLKQVLECTQEADLLAQVHYEIGLTLELGLKDMAGATQEYRRAIQSEPKGLYGLLAASRISSENGN